MNHRLTRTERLLLERLACATGYIAPDLLISALWTEWRREPAGAARTLRSHIHNLRRKIAFCGLRIVSQPYVGYRLLA